MKEIGKVKVISAEAGTSKAGNPFFRCVGMSDENQPTVFFTSGKTTVKVGDVFGQYLSYDNTLKAVVRYQKYE